jgi:uncharacterized membrane protein YdjX (TVP38/TMEM64 family)
VSAPPPERPGPGSRGPTARSRWVVAGLATALLVVFTLAFLLAESRGLEDAETWQAWLAPLRQGAGAWVAAAALIGALVADLALPVPSSVVMTLSGGLLGLVPGTLVNLVGALGAAWLGWGLCRALGEPAFARVVGEDLPAVRAWFGRWGPWAIILSRAVPMLTEIISCLAGLHGMGFLRFTALTLAGTLPVAAVYAWAGSVGATTLWVPLLVALVLPGLGYAAVRFGILRTGRAG